MKSKFKTMKAGRRQVHYDGRLIATIYVTDLDRLYKALESAATLYLGAEAEIDTIKTGSDYDRGIAEGMCGGFPLTLEFYG